MRQQCRNLPRNFDQAVGAGVDRQERLLGDTTELRVHRQAQDRNFLKSVFVTFWQLFGNSMNFEKSLLSKDSVF